MSKQRDFLEGISILADGWFGLVRKFENFELHKRINIPEIKEKLNNFKNTLLSATKGIEELIRVSDSPNLSDSYFCHMQMVELRKYEKQFEALQDEFRQLEIWVEKQGRVLAEKQIEQQIDLFGNTSRSNLLSDVHDDSYEELMRRFVQMHLTFRCPACNSRIPFGEQRCEECDHKMDWYYDMDDCLARLKSLEKKGLQCPNRGCGAKILLDWENCAFCDLDIQKMIKTMVYFDS